ncbi:hypothetical protein [Flavobacterium sp. HJJ]|uniref:hypothetical protein n=1 Tax=Flavobacterium sp. HJJ TaxID=2783792 RepID=UPI001889CF15|nr:hypothetical protein [Flavobacterium sp. HJJ]MBF4471333.1 hypothetical protein [Flavobacterium sp. HJJ]
MKSTIIFTVIFLNTLLSYGQKQHLEPATFYVGGGLENYYRNLNTLCYEGMSGYPYARFIAIPSFSKEYVFSIEKNNKEYFVISITLTESYWRAKKKDSVKFESKKNKIDENIYTKIGCLFQLLARQTKSYSDEYHGLDGESYYFLITDNNGEIKIGKTWSPDDNSLMGRLIKISNDLYSFGNGNKVSIAEINNEIDKLIIDFEK